jgi:hypothetical protein
MMYPTYLHLSSPQPSFPTAIANEWAPGSSRLRPDFRPARDDAPCLIDGGDLVVLSFVLVDSRRRYVHHGPSRIRATALRHDVYQVHAVQDFEAEWHDPDLSASLARACVIPVRADGTAGSPADFPTESRPLDYLGVLVVR